MKSVAQLGSGFGVVVGVGVVVKVGSVWVSGSGSVWESEL